MLLILLQVLIWGSLFLLVFSYLIYPFIVWFLSTGKTLNENCYSAVDQWPTVFFFMPVHNEEAVLEEKLSSLKKLSYPGTIHFFIGSDNSTDRSVEILTAAKEQFSNFHFTAFTKRQGKPNMVNQLVDQASQLPDFDRSIFLMTDASVMLEKNCLQELVKHFKNPAIFLVDAAMQSRGLSSAGISQSEGVYIRIEGLLKSWESKAFGKMMGPFGGCYALRGSYYSPVPHNFLVDDFYITMKGFSKGGDAINEPLALCYENVGQEQKEEFKRKKRISAGNFQNMMTFWRSWLPPRHALSFTFFSHKILRWCGPFFLIFATIGAAWLVWKQTTILYTLLLLFLIAWIVVIPLLDELFRRMNIHFRLLRNVTYFNAMNLALLMGFFKYLYGIKSNVWQPPKRS